MKKTLLTFFFALFGAALFAQVGINNVNPQASLEVTASNVSAPANNDGILIPRISAFPLIAPTAAQNGMLVFLTTAVGPNSPGFYYWENSSTSWQSVGKGAEEIDELNDGASDLYSIFLGNNAGANDDGLNYNIGIGALALEDNTSGDFNAAVGYQALSNNIGGAWNNAIGFRALYQNTTGWANIAIGNSALQNNTTGIMNVAIGYETLLSNSSSSNTALGYQAMRSNTSGSLNVSVGSQALFANSTGTANVGVGYQSLRTISDGLENTGVGTGSLAGNSSGDYNVAVGSVAIGQNTTGNSNVAVGRQAGYRNLTGNGNIFLGYQAGFNELGSNKLYIENTNAFDPLVYGDFNTDEFRINGSLQVGNPAGTGYQFPAIDGTANQVLQTNGSGTLSWGSSSSEWTDAGTEIYPADGTAENVLIGTTATSGYKLGIASTLTTLNLGPNSNLDIIDLTSGISFGDGIDINMTSSYNLSSRSAVAADLTYGGVSADLARFETGSFNLYGLKVDLPTNFSGTEYGIYSSVLTTNGHAGYFLGDLTVGTATTNTYTFPASRGTNGQYMQTDGVGNVSWVSAPTPTASNGLNESGGDIELGGTLTETTTITQSVYDLNFNLNSIGDLNFNLSSSGDFNIQDAGVTHFQMASDGRSYFGGETYWRNGSVSGTNIGRLYGTSAGVFDLFSGGTVAVKLNAFGDSYFNNGSFGLGTNNPQEQLDVVDNSTTFVADFLNENTGGFGDGIRVRLASATPNASEYYVGFYRGSTTLAGAIRGTIAGTGVDYFNVSDARLKTNYKPVNNALNTITKMNPLWYEYKANLGIQEMGFLAQELQDVYPQAVAGDKDSDVETDPMMVVYGRLTPLLTAGIQELEQKVSNLEEENAQLKEQLAKYESLEARILALEAQNEGNSEQSDSTVITED